MDQKAKKAMKRIEDQYFSKFKNKSHKEKKVIFRKALILAHEYNIQQWVHFVQGTLYWLDKKSEQALEEHNSALAIDSSFHYSWYGKGLALDDLGRKQEALAAFNKSIKLNSKFAHAWNGKGVVLDDLGKKRAALDAFNKAIELDPKMDSPYYNRGFIYVESGKWSKAKVEFQKFITLSDDDEWIKLAKLRLKQINAKLAAQKIPKGTSVKKGRARKTEKLIHEERKPFDVGIDFTEQYKRSGLADKVVGLRKKLDKVIKKALTPDPQLNTEYINNSLHVLRDWNSYTPILPAKFRPNDDLGPNERRGGGYFLVWRGFGVVIDPGLDFIDQLYNKKLSIADVNAVIVTHCHLDHTRDIEALIDLNYRYKKFLKNSRKRRKPDSILFYLSISAKYKYKEFLKSSGCCENPEILTGNKKYSITDYIDIIGVEVFHDDIVSQDEAIGCIFELKDETGTVVHRFGFTSDTRQDESLEEKFKGCDVLLAHLGTTETIDEVEKGLSNHLGIMGCYDLMMKVKPKLFIVGEFGEELIQARLNILEFIAKNKPEETKKVLAADSKLSIKFGDDLEVFCSHPGCESTTIPLNEVSPLLGEDSLFRYYCKKHFA